nr:MAG TPA: hypothetical protein [Caudoviricetes sp.]
MGILSPYFEQAVSVSPHWLPPREITCPRVELLKFIQTTF